MRSFEFVVWLALISLYLTQQATCQYDSYDDYQYYQNRSTTLYPKKANGANYTETSIQYDDYDNSQNDTGSEDIEYYVRSLAEKVRTQNRILAGLGSLNASDFEELQFESITKEPENPYLGSARPPNVPWKSCAEIAAFAPARLLLNEAQWVDPDGLNGFPPFRVNCITKTGETIIRHNRDESTPVGKCRAPGCFSQSIDYEAPQPQIMDLIEHSLHCHQEIKYRCKATPLNFNGMAQSWWENAYGEPQYFWDGDGKGPVYDACACGIKKTCEKGLKCYCDSMEKRIKSDEGTITNKWHLPVTRVSFGRTTSKDSWAMYTLGPLSCSGLHKPPSKESMRPKSCEGVFKLGHRLNGFYTLWNGQAVHTEYCNLADLATGSIFLNIISNGTFEADGTPGLPGFESIDKLWMDDDRQFLVAPREGVYLITYYGRSEARKTEVLMRTSIGDRIKIQASTASSRKNSPLTMTSLVELHPDKMVDFFVKSGAVSGSHITMARIASAR